MNLDSDICYIIAKFIYKPKYELLEWIDIKKNKKYKIIVM